MLIIFFFSQAWVAASALFVCFEIYFVNCGASQLFRQGWIEKNVILHLLKVFKYNFFFSLPIMALVIGFHLHWESWFAQHQPTGCPCEKNQPTNQQTNNNKTPNKSLVKFSSILWFCNLSHSELCYHWKEGCFKIFLLKASNNVNSRWLFNVIHDIWTPLF